VFQFLLMDQSTLDAGYFGIEIHVREECHIKRHLPKGYKSKNQNHENGKQNSGGCGVWNVGGEGASTQRCKMDGIVKAAQTEYLCSPSKSAVDKKKHASDRP
jgi:hypothetical protein